MTSHGLSPGSDIISIFLASALILLSIKSAIADEKEYHKDLMDSIRDGAYGTHSCSNISINLLGYKS